MKTKICVVTSSRADYGLLRFLIHKIEMSSIFDLQLVVSGSHLSKIHGYTLNEIIKDNIPISKKIETISETNTRKDIANNVSSTIQRMTKAFSEPVSGIISENLPGDSSLKRSVFELLELS